MLYQNAWNTDSVYFNDGNGNVTAFIARYDVPSKEEKGMFEVSQLVNVNEVGMPSSDIGRLNILLEAKLGLSFYKGVTHDLNQPIGGKGVFIFSDY